MEKKAHKFVALLAKKFTDACHKDIDHLEVFMLAVSNLKEGRLKSELQGNCSKYQEKFESELQGLKAEDRKVEVSSDDTSFVTRCHRVADRLEHMMLNSSELQQWVETVKKEGNSKLDHPELRALCSLLCCREDYVSLVNSMFLILSSVQGHVESCLADQDRARAVRLQRELHTILTFLYIKHGNLKGTKNIPGRQKYEDVLASLLSLYVDLVLLTSRSSETPVKVSKELCSFVFLLLSPWPAHVVDVLIQSSLPCSPDVTTVLPLARKCLKSPPIKPDCRTYTKYVVCLRSIVSALGEEVKDICQVAKSVKAPKSYLSWLREQREDLLDNLPEDRKFKGRVITQFLLHEADDALIDGLLDILTEELSEAREATEQSVSDDLTKQKSLAEETPSEDMPLFYVDKKGKDDKGNQGVKNGNEGTMGDKDGSEVIEVIEVDLSGFDMQPNEDALLHLNEDSDMDDVDEGNDLDDVDKGCDLDDIEEGSDLDDDNKSNDLVIDDDDNDGDGALAMKTYLNAAACDVDDGDEDSDVEVIDIAENKPDDSDVEVIDIAENKADDSDVEGIDIAENKADDSDVEVIDIAENKADDSDVEGIDIAENKADDRDVKGDDADGLVHKDNKDVDNADCDSDDSNDDDDDKAETQSSDEDTAIGKGGRTQNQGQMQSSPERKRHGTISVPFTRVRTRSMTSVESKDTDSSVKLKPIDGISQSQKNNGKPEEGLTESPSHMTRQRSHGDKSSPCWSLTESPSHMTRQRCHGDKSSPCWSLTESPSYMTRQRCHGDKSSPCRLCAEPHSDSTCGTAALPSGDDVEHSASKKTKRTLEKEFPEKEFPEKETRSKMATNTEGRRPSPTSKVRSQAGSRRSLAQRKSLSVTKSKKYQTRSRSGV